MNWNPGWSPPPWGQPPQGVVYVPMPSNGGDDKKQAIKILKAQLKELKGKTPEKKPEEKKKSDWKDFMATVGLLVTVGPWIGVLYFGAGYGVIMLLGKLAGH